MHHVQPSPIATQMHALLFAQALTEPNAAVRCMLLEQANAALQPIEEQVQGWPHAMRQREADLAAANAAHAAFLGPAVLHALARHEEAELAAQQLMLNAARLHL